MTVNRPERPTSRAEELIRAEARDLPPRPDGVDQRDALARRDPAAPDYLEPRDRAEVDRLAQRPEPRLPDPGRGIER